MVDAWRDVMVFSCSLSDSTCYSYDSFYVQGRRIVTPLPVNASDGTDAYWEQVRERDISKVYLNQQKELDQRRIEQEQLERDQQERAQETEGKKDFYRTSFKCLEERFRESLSEIKAGMHVELTDFSTDMESDTPRYHIHISSRRSLLDDQKDRTSPDKVRAHFLEQKKNVSAKIAELEKQLKEMQ